MHYSGSFTARRLQKGKLLNRNQKPAPWKKRSPAVAIRFPIWSARTSRNTSEGCRRFAAARLQPDPGWPADCSI